MNGALIIVITGLPCTGKTTLGRYVACALNLPFIHKDGIKESLFDSLGWRDRDWSRKLGVATYSVLDYLLSVLMPVGVSFVVESNFDPDKAGARLAFLVEQHGYSSVQILCKADGATLMQRFRARSESGDRHPGHVDNTNLDELVPQLLKGRLDPLALAGPLIEVDTTSLALLDYDLILKQIEKIISVST